MILYALIGAIVGIILGIVIGRYLLQSLLKSQVNTAEKEAQNIVNQAKIEAEKVLVEAESKKKEKILESKEKFQEMKSAHDSEVNRRNQKLLEGENKLKQKDQQLSQELEKIKKQEKELENSKNQLAQQTAQIEKKKEELEKSSKEFVSRLEKIANYTAEEAKNDIVESMKEKARTDAMIFVKEAMDEAKNKANKEAKKIVIQTIQRTAAEQAIENSVSVFPLENDDIKGQIIGREGRNIRALEKATGIEIIVDDTPEAIVLSGFDPVRREIARLSLQRLVADGRIHPARIEEVVSKTEKQINEQIMEIGERTVIDLGITGLHQELIRYVGRMRFRSSYGQNLLQHSREVANLCGIMASELGLNAKLAKRAGLLHDIGKVMDEETELSHALAGMKLCEKYNEHPSICNAVGAHHDEIEMKFMISPIIQACDAISGARPGARREMIEQYMKRLKDLEELAMSYNGVSKAYAIQAGRELRVLVEADKVSDQQSDEISFSISARIQEEMQYPGQIRVTVIREKRAVSIAR